MTPYATVGELEAYLGERVSLPEDPARLLDRASEFISSVTNGVLERFETDYAGEFTQVEVEAALRDATCAQVEFWIEIGEEFDIANPQGSVAAGKLSMSQLPPKLALRAKRHLRSVALMGSAVAVV